MGVAHFFISILSKEQVKKLIRENNLKISDEVLAELKVRLKMFYKRCLKMLYINTKQVEEK